MSILENRTFNGNIYMTGNYKKISARANIITLYKESPGGQEMFTIKYIENRRLQEKISEFITSFVEYFPDIFTSYCSQCGNCCRRKNIFLTSGELFPLATHLGITEEKFHSTYLKEGETWSPCDGYIKLSDGKCPFLEKKPSGRYECKIYINRPLDCVSFQPSSELCKKPLFDLIEQIQSLEIENDKVRVLLWNTMEIYERTLTTALIEKLSEVINVIEALNLPAGGKETKEILDRIEPVIKCLEERKTSINNVIKAINILKAKFQEIWDKRGIYDNKIRHLWVRLSNLENEYGTNSPKVSKTPLTSYSDLIVTHPYIVKEITFFPESMNINYYLEDKNLTHSVKYKKTILKSIRKFLKDITIFLKNHFTSTIENYIPKCYNCGKCCSIFTVCIAPSDIRRLADEFNISEEEVRKKYIVSPEENVNTGYWNPGSGIIKKTEEKICVFMKKGNLCSIHPFKPGICKQYEPGKRQCYTTIDDDHYYRLLSNIRAVTFNNQTISIITDYTYENFPGPLILNWYDYPLLKNSIEVILSKLKKNLPDLLAKS